MEELKINVFSIVGNSFCVEADDGNKVYDSVHKALKEKRKIIISFQNVEMLTSAFLNTAIGQLYRDFKEEYIKNHIEIEGLSVVDRALLKRVTSTAKLYYKNPGRMKKSIEDILGE